MNSENAQTRNFWGGFIRAIEAEPCEAEYIRGASGFRHKVAAIGLDKNRHRLILVSCERDARAAAFAHADLQSAFRAVQVVVARPSAVEIHDHVFEERKEKTVRPPEETATDVSLKKGDASFEDRRAGLCYIPLEDYSTGEIELISSAADIEAIRATFRRHNLLQYFFPAPDHLALGLIESGRVSYLHQLIDQLVRTPDFGHPFGPAELMKAFYSFTEMVKELQNLGLVNEGARGLELTDEGFQVRRAVRDTPREGLLYKILNRLEANLYLKSLLLPKIIPAGSSEEEVE